MRLLLVKIDNLSLIVFFLLPIQINSLSIVSILLFFPFLFYSLFLIFLFIPDKLILIVFFNLYLLLIYPLFFRYLHIFSFFISCSISYLSFELSLLARVIILFRYQSFNTIDRRCSNVLIIMFFVFN
jgi:hypothetical protein